MIVNQVVNSENGSARTVTLLFVCNSVDESILYGSCFVYMDLNGVYHTGVFPGEYGETDPEFEVQARAGSYVYLIGLSAYSALEYGVITNLEEVYAVNSVRSEMYNSIVIYRIPEDDDHYEITLVGA